MQEKVRRLGILHVAAHSGESVVDVSVHDQKIEPAVEVSVEEEAAEAKAAARQPAHFGFRRLVGVEAAAGAVIKAHHFVIEISDDQARDAGVVVIGGVDTHAGAGFAVFAEG